MRKLLIVLLVCAICLTGCGLGARTPVSDTDDTLQATAVPQPEPDVSVAPAEVTEVTPEPATPKPTISVEMSPAVLERMQAELSSLGNLVANIQNNGCVTYDDQWIYYIPDGSNGSIYRHHFDGTGAELVAKAIEPWSLSLHGDWLYFQNYGDEDLTTAWLTRVPKTGGRTERVYPMDDVASFVIMDNVLYFTNFGNTERQGLYRVPFAADGTPGAAEIIIPDCIEFLPDPMAKCLYTYQGEPDLETAQFVAYDTDGQFLGALWEGPRTYPLQVGENFIYLQYDENATTVYVRRLGAEEAESVDSGAYAEYLPNGEHIFYLDYDNQLFRAPGIGKLPVRLREEAATALQFAGDWVYFNDNPTEDSSGRPNWRLNGAVTPYTAEKVE